ncbi:AAA domain-containing protein [Xylophilus sp. Kf1]|nr:AAA domain-containing protein [Xylophilus sp. Kf1]
MVSPPDTAPLGVLVCQGDTVTAAHGLCADPAEQARLREAMAAAENPSMFSVSLAAGPCLAVRIVSGRAVIVLLRPLESRGTLLDFVAAVPFAYDILEEILNDPYRALTVADHAGNMRYISPVHEKFLGLAHGGGIGRSAASVIPNSRLKAVVDSGKAEIGQPLKLADGVTRVVSRRPIRRNGRVVGAVGQVMFRDAEALSQMAAETTRLRNRLAFYRRELDDLRETRGGLAELIGESQLMQRLRHEVATVARLDLPVLILGESGTGKELVARAIHRLGRPDHAMVSVNLAALPSSLVESELFGHAAGAFTGATRQGRAGKFEMADDGTLFLDEVGDIPPEVQIKLLRVLDDPVVERLGSHAARRTRFRLVSATHRDLDALVAGGAFRHDLFYRLSGVTLRVPPLRQRLEDIPTLTTHFVEGFCGRNRLPVPRIDAGVLRYLAERPWPGNLRQLRHRIEEALVFSDPRRLTPDAFEREPSVPDGRADTERPSVCAVSERPADEAGAAPAKAPKRWMDHGRSAALEALRLSGGNKRKAAEALGISRSYFYKLLG